MKKGTCKGKNAVKAGATGYSPEGPGGLHREPQREEPALCGRPDVSAEEADNMLAHMMERQREIYDLNGMPTIDYTRPLGKRAKMAIEEGISDFVKSCIHEAVELEGFTEWKPWSGQLGNKWKGDRWSPEHIELMREEVIDLQAFVFNLAHLLGMTPEMLYVMFNQKMNVVLERHNSGTY